MISEPSLFTRRRFCWTGAMGATAALAPAAPTQDLDLNAMLQPAPATAKWSEPGYFVWCGSMVRDDHGSCHLYYSRWPKRYGFSAWVTHSEVAHAVGDTPEGPFHFADVVLPARGAQHWDGLCTHNPTILRIGRTYCLYYMGNTGDGVASKTLNWTHRNHQRIGLATATHPNGPWTRRDRPVLDVSQDADAPDALMVSNPSVFVRKDGTLEMIYKGVARKRPMPFGGPVVHLTATAKQPEGPFTKQLQPIFLAAGVDFPAEDPFAWYDRHRDRYYAVVKDMKGHFTGAGRSLALWESSDGFAWKLAPHPLVSALTLQWEGGQQQKLIALERPQLLFNAKGEPETLLAAVDATEDQSDSFNVRIPLKLPPTTKRY